MGKKTRNREILGLLNSKNNEKICQFAKENNLIRNEAPFCENKNCNGLLADICVQKNSEYSFWNMSKFAKK